MRVKYIGKDRIAEVWKNQSEKRNIQLINGYNFNVEYWCGINSVVTEYGEWICDEDSPCFKQEFEAI